MGIKLQIPVYVDVYFTEEGVGLYVSSSEESPFEEQIVPFKKLVEEFLDMHVVPSRPPTIHEEDREKVKEFIDSLFRAVDYLRKLEHDTPTYVSKDILGHRD